MTTNVPSATTNATIKLLQDIMRKDAGVDGDAQRIAQLAWMIFLKVLDEKEREYESRDSMYTSPLPERLRWRSWTTPNGLSNGALLAFVNDELFPILRDLPGAPDSLAAVARAVFSDAQNHMRSGALLRQLITKINSSIHFSTAHERHVLGDLYEKILRDLQSAGNAGEYYTPRAVTEFAVEMVDPKIGEIVLDPACGTGGFLTCAIEHVRKRYVACEAEEQTLQQMIRGVEKKPLPHLLCMTNLILHGIEVPSNARQGNALGRPLGEYEDDDLVDVVVTNPPFGGEEEDEIIANFPIEFRSKETADSFLVLIMHILKGGGRAAVVLPDGFLFGEGRETRIKQKLLRECDLHTIVRLPKGVFSPYTDITTNILFFTKGRPTTEVWYYEHPYPAGYKSYSKTKPIRLDEFEAERQWWGNRVENEHAWKVSRKQIEASGYNLDFRNPHRSSLASRDLGVLVSDYKSSCEVVASLRNQLRAELAAGLLDQQASNNLPAGVCSYLLEYFDLLTADLEARGRLRDFVLKLAMRGRLVPQREDEEPASALYECLTYLKDQANGDKRHRETTRVLPPRPDEHPYEVPASWRWVRLGDIGEVVGGGTPDTSNPSYFADAGIRWLTPADLYQLKGKYIGRGKRDISELGLRKSGARLLPKGSVLFSSRAPIGYVAIAENDVSTNQGFKSCVPYLMEMNEYVYYVLLAAAKEIDSKAPGTTFREVSGKIMKQVLFPLPPLAEQHRIVTKLDHIMALLGDLETTEVSRHEARRSLSEAILFQAIL